MSETIFKENQFNLAYPKGIENHYWTYARNQIIYNQLGNNKLRDKRILDIGCGNGIVVNFLRGKGYDCWGVDRADNPVRDEGVKDFLFFNQDANNLPENFRETIGGIMLLDVIEHLPEPTAFLSELIKNFSNVKYFILTVPARNELWSNYDEYFGHFRRYDLQMLEKNVKQVNLTVIDIGYIFHSLYLPAKIFLRFQKKRPIRWSAPKSILSLKIHFLLAKIFYLDYLFLPKKIYGTSIICCATLQSIKR